MARSAEGREELLALVPEGGRFEGLVAARGDARLDGSVEGLVLVGGRLEVGEKARVRGRVEAGEIMLGGRVEGPVRARQRAELGPCAVLAGDVSTPRLVAADGCRFDGRLEMPPALPQDPDPR